MPNLFSEYKDRSYWLGHVTRMLQEILTGRILLVAFTRKRFRGRPKTRWSDYISDLAWSCLGVEPAELSKVAENGEVFPGLSMGNVPWDGMEQA